MDQLFPALLSSAPTSELFIHPSCLTSTTGSCRSIVTSQIRRHRSTFKLKAHSTFCRGFGGTSSRWKWKFWRGCDKGRTMGDIMRAVSVQLLTQGACLVNRNLSTYFSLCILIWYQSMVVYQFNCFCEDSYVGIFYLI